jgi:hypothetical protein
VKAFNERGVFLSIADFVRVYKEHCNRSEPAIDGMIRRLQRSGKIKNLRVPESTYPIFNKPLTMHGDALIMGDLECPYHHAEFIDKCLELADRWRIRQCILGGDIMHLDSLSSFSKNWRNTETGGITLEARQALYDASSKMSAKDRQILVGVIEEEGIKDEEDGLSTELAATRAVLHRIADQFDLLHIVLGNHEGRMIRALETVLSPDDILRLLGLGGKWQIAPFYYSLLTSSGETFRVTHPKNYGKGTSRKLASKYRQHCIMMHGHHFLLSTDPSGEWLAAEIGHCSDEERLAYIAQRDNTADKHVLGAAIVQGGKLHLLNRFVDWDLLMKV